MIILRARKNVRLSVSEEQSDILIGCILGDAYITKLGKVQIEQGDRQAAYVWWKYEKLRSISYGPPRRVVRYDKQDKRTTISYRFWTRQFFREWRQRFYSGGRKVIPSDLVHLSPLTMAVWYMDDGSLREDRRVILSTESFDLDERKRIKALLETSFDVVVRLKGDGKILVGTRQTRKLLAHIKPYIVKSMDYKVP